MPHLPFRLAAWLLTAIALLCQLSCSSESASRPAATAPPPSPAAPPPPPPEYQVVVYGATASGVMAAISAARQGMKVALVEPGNHVGGMVSGGLGYTDYGRKYLIGGQALEFFRRAGEAYGEEVAWRFEPHVAETVLKHWLEQAGVRVFFGRQVVSARKEGAEIRAMETDDGAVFTAYVFIDASYEGDLMARAGVAYTVGREGRSRYGESLAGRQQYSASHQFTVPVPAYDESNRLLPLLSQPDQGNPGDGDRKVQAYNYRLCMTDNRENQVPFPRPAGYDPKRYELLKRYLALKGANFKLNNLMYLGELPNGKTDTNNAGPISTDFIGGNWDYPEADYARREQIKEEHKRYIQGFLYFLANDPSVPATLQADTRKWGLAKDEFTDTGNWPHQIYVREARRMIGSYVMTQADLQTERFKEDSIGMGSYNSDSHHVQRYATPEGTVLNEGGMEVPVQPYQIPYRSITPKEAECRNLLVPVCLSASHVAFSSLRMEPQFMIMGEAAGLAASLAVRASSAVQGIDLSQLQSLLRARQQVLGLADANLLRTTPPTGGILINGGAATASSTSVTVSLFAASAANTVTEMSFSKDLGAHWTTWEPFAATRGVTLTPAENGPKSISVRYHDSWGNVSETYTATITLNLPQVPTGAITINGGSAVSQSLWATLTLSASCTSGPVVQMQLSKDGGATWYPWEPYDASRDVTLAPAGDGLKSVSVRYMDQLGYISDVYSAYITVQGSAPGRRTP